MYVMFILIGFSLLVALFFLAAYFWASHTGQYDDTHTPAMRILHDDDNEFTGKS